MEWLDENVIKLTISVTQTLRCQLECAVCVRIALLNAWQLREIVEFNQQTVPAGCMNFITLNVSMFGIK